MSGGRNRGFTLVEVLIVVVIMAVLAAVVIPQFSASTEDAQRSAGEFNLSTLRSVIQIYKAQHNSANPPFDATKQTLTVLMNKTLGNGTIDNTNGPYGPYLVEFPENPYTKAKNMITTTDTTLTGPKTAGNTGGWVYNPTTGQIWLDSNPGYDF